MRIGRDITPYIVLILFSQFCLVQAQDSTTIKTPNYPSQVRAKASVDQHRVAQNRTLTLIVEVTWAGDLDRFEIEKCSSPSLTNLEVASSASSNWVGEKDGRLMTVKTYEFILQPQALGMAYIDGVTIEYRDLDTEQVHSLVTGRLDVTVDDPVVERDYAQLVLPGLGGLFIVMLAVSGAYYLKKRREQKVAELAQVERAIPLEQRFLDELKSTMKSGDDSIGDSFSELAKLLRSYLSEKYCFAAAGMTPAEIRNELERLGVPDGVVQQVAEVLETSDIAKFSGGQIERAKLDRAHVLIEQIIEQNSSSERAHLTVEGNGSD